MELKGSQTEKNLMEAFAGESQARNKYTYFASVAKKEGYEQISEIFQHTADNEKEHAKMWFKLINGGIGTTIFLPQRKAKIMSGQICTTDLQKLPKKKVLQNLPQNSAW